MEYSLMSTVSPLQCLVLIACQAQTTDKKFAYAKKTDEGYCYMDKKDASAQDLHALIDHFKTDSSNLTFQERQIVDEALSCLDKRILEKQSSGVFSKVWSFLTRTGNKENLDTLHQLIHETRLKMFVTDSPVRTEAHARVRFSNHFKETFHTTPKALIEKEAVLVDLISKKIWYSSNVQDKDETERFAKYSELMAEFYSGSHMIFEEDQEEQFIPTLKATIQSKKGVGIRVSSHYGKIGEETHHDIQGQQLPEILFHEGTFAAKTEKNKLKIIPGKYLAKLTEKEKEDTQKIHAFWIQNERTPDGPGWLNWIKHRTLDFGHYYFLKKIIHSPRPQIANYVGPKGRGRPDTNPIFIRLQHHN